MPASHSVENVIKPYETVELTLINPERTEETRSVLSKVIRIDGETLNVQFQASLAPPESKWLTPNSVLRCMVHRKDGIWGFLAHVRHYVSGPGAQLSLHLPEDVEHIQRRRHVRVNFNGDVALDYVPFSSLQKNTSVKPQHMVVKAVNISAGGIRLLSAKPLKNEQVLTCSFNLLERKQNPLSPHKSRDDYTYQLQGKVVYGYSLEDNPSTKPILLQERLLMKQMKYVLAVQFEPLPPSLERKLVQECFQLEIQSGRKAR